MLHCFELSHLDTIDADSGNINAVVETQRGARAKLEYDPKYGLIRLDKFLPAGAVFPHNFGFFPSTVGEDGDPLDVLVLTDESLPSGTLVWVRLIGAIEAEQTHGAKTIRNDRLIAIPIADLYRRHINNLNELDDTLIAEIEHFFISYNEAEGRQYKPIARSDAKRARELLDHGMQRFREQSA